MRCSNKLYSTTKVLTVTQESKCLTTLSKQEKFKTHKYMFDYDETKETASIGNAFELFFQNSDSANCPATTCELKSSGCNFDYDGVEFIIGKSSPFLIKSRINVAKGYDKTFCVSCSNGHQTISQDDIQVKQSKHVPATLALIVIIILLVLFAVVGFFCYRSRQEEQQEKKDAEWKAELE